MRLRAFAAATVLAGTAVLGSAAVASAHDGPDGASASAVAEHSPGVLSGNIVQVPVDVPINACGNSIGLISLLNPAVGNSCMNG
ncbi:chaplin [Streptomyces sp. VRA16 Mangrove soil]|uniref:chaplin n=1 Tax=Streptomyces sp. VRA16 Mangrove soil TaxID=2817434 RepID=UPI001A9F9C0A|nr:chaplin [Streptomyces sp. VRA16 Mangrove soil]MBO1337381.1 chaplin [Streptomyces sp. VRA16 Mangrove soil]